MASFYSLTLLSFLNLLLLLSAAARNHCGHSPISKPKAPSYSSIPVEIEEACKASRDPSTCEAVLVQPKHFPSQLTMPQIIQSALGVSSEYLKQAQSMVKNILDASTGNLNLTNAAKLCIEVLGYSEYRLNLTAEEVLTRGTIKDARAWMSAAMVYQYDCWSALKYVNGTSQVNETMAFLNSLIGYSSNALGMIVNYDNFGNETVLQPAEDGARWVLGIRCWWEGLQRWGTYRADLKPDITVCKVAGAGGCDYETVQQAVNAAPENEVTRRFVIWIKAGLYEEIVRVPLEKRNLVFLGDGMGKTIITGSMNVGQLGVSTYDSATVDTLYAHSMRQYYKSCCIQGNVDFIFGNSATFFQDCDILVAPRQLNPEKGENNAITALGRINPAQSTGFVFHNCLINGTADYMNLYYSKPKVHKNFLGRPWKEYSKTVSVQCTLEALVSADGWMPWSGSFAFSTLYYGELKSTGPGANTTGRVPWSSQIPAEHVGSYSVQNFIQGDRWIPSSS